jgi:Arc/MetJ-type ribon-helix-helix transcriptional regulator
MIQEADEQKIDELKEKLGAKTKIEVVRAGLKLLEQEADRRLRIERWKRAARIVADSSAEVNHEFQAHSRLKRT